MVDPFSRGKGSASAFELLRQFDCRTVFYRIRAIGRILHAIPGAMGQFLRELCGSPQAESSVAVNTSERPVVFPN